MWTPYKDLETIEDIMPLLEDNNKLMAQSYYKKVKCGRIW